MTEQTNDQVELDLVLDAEEPVTGEGKTIVIDNEGKEVKSATTKVGEVQESPEETITKLRKEIEETKTRESAAREENKRLAGERSVETNKAVTAINEAYKAKEDSLETAIGAAKTDLDSIKRQLRDAREKGDIDTEIDLEEKLADGRYQFNALTWQKNNLLHEKKTREEAVKSAPVNQNQQTGYSPKAQAWIDQHPRFNTDDDYQAMVFASHDLATKRGIAPDSPAYFDFIEGRMHKFFPDEGETTVVVTPPAQVVTRSSQPQSLTTTAAPPSRSSGPSHKIGTNGSQVTLTAAQLEAAEFMGMTPVEYAQDLINQEKEKKGLN